MYLTAVGCADLVSEQITNSMISTIFNQWPDSPNITSPKYTNYKSTISTNGQLYFQLYQQQSVNMKINTYHQTVLRTAPVWTQLRNQCRLIIVNRLDFGSM